MESQIKGVDILGHTINVTLLYHMTTQDPLFHASIEAIQRAAIENLKSLDLSLFALRQIPPEIGKLKHLESLRVSSKNLKEIPKEIGELQQLKSLEITSCKLTSLPEEIGQLSLLRSVKLNSNQFEEFPLGICNLTSLVYFDISSNLIQILPSDIKALKNLRYFDISRNCLRELPPQIGGLANLEFFHIKDNEIEALPDEIGNLSKLQKMTYGSNPFLKRIPPEIRHRGWAGIVNFYRQKGEGIDSIYEAKLLIVGEGGAGKTSLTKKINNQEYHLVSYEDSTQGIDIIQWRFTFGENREFRVNIWDFGGQEVYHSTHQFFLTKRSLYILVADSRKEDTDFYYWLNVVDLLSESCPILIVQNEKQDRQREIGERQLRSEFLNLRGMFATNLLTNRGLDKIKQEIQNYITQLPHIGNEIPRTWVKVRKFLEDCPKSYITLEEYFKVCQENGFTRDGDKLQLSGYLHDLGVCLHFQEDDLLCRTIILKPKWGTDAVYKVLDNHQVIQNLGKFSKNDLSTIWNDEDYSTMRPELLRLMMNFKLCYEIPSCLNTYIAPQLLSSNQPEYYWDESNNLLLRYSYEFMPKGILTRFIVELHPWIEEQKLVWRTGVILNKENARAEVIELYHRKEIRIRVCGERKHHLLIAIRHELEKIHSSYEKLRYTTLVPCNCRACKNADPPHFYALKTLHKFLDDGEDKIQCPNSYNMIYVQGLIEDNRVPEVSNVDRNQVFISYSHRDRELFDELKIWLKPLERNGLLNIWDDTQITPGEIWRSEIEQALETAKVAVLLVSPYFLASDFIHNNELPPLLDKSCQNGLTIIWIPIDYSPYRDTKIERYQSAHPPEQPLSSLNKSERNKAWSRIYERIKTSAGL